MRCVFALVLALALASSAFGAETETVEGGGCPFALDVPNASEMTRRSGPDGQGIHIGWNWRTVKVWGYCVNTSEPFWLQYLNKGQCNIEPAAPHNEVCFLSRRWDGAEVLSTRNWSRQTDDVHIQYAAIHRSGWVLYLTARGKPPLQYGTEDYQKALEDAKALAASVRWTGQP